MANLFRDRLISILLSRKTTAVLQDTKGAYSFKTNTSTFGRINSWTNFKFGRFVAYIANLSLHYGAEYQGFAHYMHWICCSLSKNHVCLRPPMYLIVYTPFNRKTNKHLDKIYSVSFPLHVNPCCIFRLQGSQEMIELPCWSSDRLRKQAFLNDSDTCVPWRAVKTHISLLSCSWCLCDMFVSAARRIRELCEFFHSFWCRWHMSVLFWSRNWDLYRLLIISDGVVLHDVFQNRPSVTLSEPNMQKLITNPIATQEEASPI